MFLWAFVGIILAHLGDIISTELCLHLVSSHESNDLLATATGHLLLGRAVYIKTALALVDTILPALFLTKLSRSWLLGSLYFWPELYRAWGVVINNMTVLFSQLAQRINF